MIAGYVIALGPYVLPLFFALYAGGACLAMHLIVTGHELNSMWRVLTGVSLAILLVAELKGLVY
ncbi:MAG: hypothetical protein PS018_11585 [bacterium]|nr:hypothetical protein [bacterium]